MKRKQKKEKERGKEGRGLPLTPARAKVTRANQVLKNSVYPGR